ncbi:MAG: [Fe-Fe] hydrogenase large subunit C-terminal domain-containing protein [bacterium]
MHRVNGGSIQTIKERCRVCYMCVRECPAKAIRINDGQAEVLAIRCIGCGNCVRVCSQKAKQVVSTIGMVREFLQNKSRPVVAMIAPSFPAEFTDVHQRALAGMIRSLGFDGVYEVGFGADLVAQRYRELVESGDTRPRIASTCPAVVFYVEKYHPALVDSLLPVVSPMIAMARVVRRVRGDRQLRVVFVGPCIAKKSECVDAFLPGDVDAVLTYAELREMFAMAGVTAKSVAQADFDEPRAGLGALFAVSRGLLQAADIPEDLLAKEIVATDGCKNFVDAIKAFEAGAIDTRLLELLA